MPRSCARVRSPPAIPSGWFAGPDSSATMPAMVRVSRLSIAPVRALGLQHPEFIDVERDGVLEDRRFYLVDGHGRLVDRLLAGGLVQVAAETNPGATWLPMTLSGGRG